VRPDLIIQQMERDFLPALRKTTEAISDELGYGAPSPLPNVSFPGIVQRSVQL
jgi:hypothetical protein